MTHTAPTHIHQADPPHNPHRPHMRLWTDEEWQKVVTLRAEGRDLEYIAGCIRRTVRQIREKIRWVEMPESKRAERRARINSWRNANNEYKSVKHIDQNSASKATPSMLAERDQRMLAPRSLTAMFMGDPSPGFSALDRKRAAT